MSGQIVLIDKVIQQVRGSSPIESTDDGLIDIHPCLGRIVI